MTLTRENILAMSNWRQLDALVAEKVMGLDMVEDTLPQLPKYYRPEYERTIFTDVPLYSTEISAALEVLEKMRNNKIYLDIRIWPDEYQVLPHQDENNKLIERWIVQRPSLPEAICKAALLAVLNL